MKTIACTAVAFATLSGAANAQCTINRYGVPDFDQRRTGLSNNGGMHCVPTSFTNIRGYIANNGYGNIMSGPRNWQSQTNYNYVTARINAMGTYMSTSGANGTKSNNAYNGWNDFIEDWHEDKFTLSSWSGYVPPAWLFIGMIGGLTNVCYGYYKPQGGGVFDRDGGHCVTLVGLKGLCTNFNEPTFRIRNPASDDGDLAVQSVFSTEETRTAIQGFNYDGNWVNRHRMLDFGVDSTTRRYLDQLWVVWPQVCLTGKVTFGSDFHIYKPVKVFGLNNENSSSQTPSPGMEILQVALHPMGVEAYALKVNTATNQHRLYKQDLTTGVWTTVLPTFTAERANIAVSRFGHLFVHADGSVKKYDLNQGSYPLLAQATAPGPIVDMEYDDKKDEIVAITTNGRFVRFNNDLTPRANQPFPTGVSIMGDGSVFPDPTMPDRWYICSSGSPTMYRVMTDSPTVDRIHIDSLITFPAGTEPRSLVMTDSGHLVFSDRGVIADWKFTNFGTHAAWAPDPSSAIAGLPAGRSIEVSRSRNNFVAGVHDQPKWQNDSYQDEGVVPVPDCNPDLNVDGQVDILDFLAFFDSFGQCQLEPGPCGAAGVNADYNNDGLVDILDMLDFVDDFSYGCV
ncbi:MAG: hypothetical protein KF912_09680 [Phycisphaeraceae bacterium]|nr:hypothetical protein [Phycisphaeraceae bacterium]